MFGFMYLTWVLPLAIYCRCYMSLFQTSAFLSICVQALITSGRRTACGQCLCGCPSWLLASRAWRRSSGTTGPNLDATTSAGEPCFHNACFVPVVEQNPTFQKGSLGSFSYSRNLSALASCQQAKTSVAPMVLWNTLFMTGWLGSMSIFMV